MIALIAGLFLCLGAAACGSDSDSAESGAGGEITVFAAASLTEAFTEIGEVYEERHGGSEVTLNFAGSSALAAQINAGAPADVFASADQANMEKVTDQGLTEGDPRTFVGNVLEIAMPKGNPGSVGGLEDLAKGDLRVAVCAPEVPCGNAARLTFGNAGVDPSIDTYEPNVKAVLTKVELGEADAGLVYRSDVIASGDEIESIPIPRAVEVVNRYPIALVADDPNPEGGREFIDLVLGEVGRAELRKRGFRNP